MPQIFRWELHQEWSYQGLAIVLQEAQASQLSDTHLCYVGRGLCVSTNKENRACHFCMYYMLSISIVS